MKAFRRFCSPENQKDFDSKIYYNLLNFYKSTKSFDGTMFLFCSPESMQDNITLVNPAQFNCQGGYPKSIMVS